LHLDEMRAVERAPHFSANALGAHDAGAREAAEVPRHERRADAQAPNELGHRALAFGREYLDDAEARDVAERAVVCLQLAEVRLAEHGSPSLTLTVREVP
jgi:hypothetical protein